MANGVRDGLEDLFRLFGMLFAEGGVIIAFHIFHDYISQCRSLRLWSCEGIINFRDANDVRIGMAMHVSLDGRFSQRHTRATFDPNVIVVGEAVGFKLNVLAERYDDVARRDLYRIHLFLSERGGCSQVLGAVRINGPRMPVGWVYRSKIWFCISQVHQLMPARN